MIADSLRDLAVPLDQLRPLEGNPRRGDVAAVRRSLERFGQRKPVVARADGTVIAGNHMLAAARELGWPALAVTRVDDDDATAKAFALADNRTADLGSFDPSLLAAMIAEVEMADADLLLAASYGPDAEPEPFDPASEWAGMPEYESENLGSVFHTVVHFRSDEDARAFFKFLGRQQVKTMWWPERDGHLGATLKEAYASVNPSES